jgi:type 1 fimbria pilin
MKLRYLAVWGLLATGAICSEVANATCRIDENAEVALAFGGRLVVDPDLPLNSVIASRELTGDAAAFYRCDQEEAVDIESVYQLNGADQPGQTIREIRTATGEPTGVGLRLWIRDNGEGDYLPVPYRKAVVFPNTNNARRRWETDVRLDLVVVGPIRHGVTESGRLGRTVVRDSASFPNILLRTIVNRGYELIAPTCSIDAGSLNQIIDLGAHTVGSFADQNATAWTDFSLTATSCTNPVETIAGITFGQGADADANNPNLFSMNQGGPGGLGIAIQAADGNNAPMLPGETRDFAAVAAGNSYRFQARLERTGGEVTAGAVNRPVTVRVTFR